MLETAEEIVGKKKCGAKRKSWWGEEIGQLVGKKKIAYKKYLRSRDEGDKKSVQGSLQNC